MKELVDADPLISDERLAEKLKVSIHTVRSDRKRIGMPEARIRAHDLSSSLFGQSTSLPDKDIVGELLETTLDQDGLSLLDTTENMDLQKARIVRGHILFAQANSLANAIVDSELALTLEARVQYLSPVETGERILAKARVVKIRGNRREIEVIMKTRKKTVFQGEFTIRCVSRKLAGAMHYLKETK